MSIYKTIKIHVVTWLAAGLAWLFPGVPTLNSCGVDIRPFDPDNPLWQAEFPKPWRPLDGFTLSTWATVQLWPKRFRKFIAELTKEPFKIGDPLPPRKEPEPPEKKRHAVRGRAKPHPFDLDYPLLKLSPVDTWNLWQAVEGTHVFGGNGSGKTSGPYRTIVREFLRLGYGGIVFTTKPDDYTTLKDWCEELGVADRLIRFSPEERFRFNPFDYEAKRGGQRGGGHTENIVSMLSEVHDSLDRGQSAGGNKDPFWRAAGQQITRNSVDALKLGDPGGTLSMTRLHEVIMSAPVSREQIDSEAWQERSLCYRLLNAAQFNENLSAQERSDLQIVGRYFLNELPSLSPETRSSVVAMFTTVADIFTRGVIGNLFGSGTNIVPELSHQGAIICIDLPVKVFSQAGVAAQVLLKFVWQQACERRDVNANPRPVFAAMDEAQNIVNSRDILFQTTARSSRCCSIYMTQTISNYNFALGEKGKEMAMALLGVCQNQFFCGNTDSVTNTYAADYFSKSFQHKFQAGTTTGAKGEGGTNAGSSLSLEHNIQPAECISLKRGGPQNAYLVEAIIGSGGRVFNATGKTSIKTAFSQL